MREQLSMFDSDPVGTMETTFVRGGRAFIVTVVTDTFIIGTAIDAARDKRGEVVNDYDVTRVER